MAREIGMGGKAPERSRTGWERYLAPDEKFLWQGAPVGGIRFSPILVFLSIFGMIFAAIPMVALFSVSINSGTIIDYILYGVIWFFILIGLAFIIGPWPLDAKMRNSTRYALTDKRAIIASTLFGRVLSSYPLNGDAPLEHIKGRLDTVNFSFSSAGVRQQEKDATPHTNPLTSRNAGPSKRITGTPVTIGFRSIADGQEVFALLQAARRAET